MVRGSGFMFGRSDTILFVKNQDVVRKLTVRILQDHSTSGRCPDGVARRIAFRPLC